MLQGLRLPLAPAGLKIGGLHLQRAQGFNCAPKAVRPVETGPNEQLEAAIDGVHAVAVVLYFVEPAGPPAPRLPGA